MAGRDDTLVRDVGKVRRTLSALGPCLAGLGLLLGGCSARGGASPADAGAADATELLARAEALAVAGAALPARAEVLALAQGVAAEAVREGAGRRAMTLNALAATLHERMYRLERREQDGKEALSLFESAGRDLAIPGACAAAVRGAVLAGEMAHDAQITYGELHRVARRASAKALPADVAAACARATREVEARLEGFRPPSAVLDAIDNGLAEQGAVPVVLRDAGGAELVNVAPRITRVEHWAGDEAARVVVHLDRPARFRVGDVAGADGRGARTYVELDGVDLGDAGGEAPLGGIVSRVKTEPTTTGSRVALDLDGPGYRRVFHLLEPYRIVIDVARQPPAKAGAGSRAVARVVVDPGHGGYDPGAIGPTGVREKDVTLAVAHKVAPLLASLGIEVALTRDDDRFVTLEERTARANAYGADLFVSIHCNATERASKHGVETYVLDTTTSDMANRVAARENGASQAASAEVAQLLASMRLADQATRSTRLAELLQKSGMASLSRYPDVTDGGVHRAGFYVLVGARMPAVLFETSYISNAVEERRLGSEDYQARLADAITNAVKAYREGR